MTAPVLTSRSGGVLTVTINRPEVRNAVNAAVAEGIAAAMDELDSDDALACGVLTGAPPAFCAGMDLKAFLAGERPAVDGRGFAGLVECPPAKPLIAAVEGHAVGGGFEIALCCDLIVAAENAVFGLPEVRRGLLAGGGGLLRLPRRVAYHRAMEWILTGRTVTAAEAYTAQLLTQVEPAGETLAAAHELAAAIAANGPLAIRASKQIMTEAPGWPAGEAFSRQQAIYAPVRASRDAAEGALAFTEKRAPVWRGC
jgi:enoyl-CoA hydratase